MKLVIVLSSFFLYAIASGVWLSYCTDIASSEVGLGMVYGVRCSPPTNSCEIPRVSIYCEAIPPTAYAPIDVQVWHVFNGFPTSMFCSNTVVTTGTAGWKTFDTILGWNDESETEFLIAAKPMQNYITLAYSKIGIDVEMNPPDRNWEMPVSMGSWAQGIHTGDYMIRVEICGLGVEASSVGRIKSVFYRD
jgi:hypothetical protein